MVPSNSLLFKLCRRGCLVFCVLLLAVLLPGAALPAQAVEFQRGDSNIDSRFDISDAVAIIGYLFRGEPKRLPCEDAADTNDDSQIDLTDAVFSLGYFFLGGPNPPAPHFECGPDPTEDAFGCETSGCTASLDELFAQMQAVVDWGVSASNAYEDAKLTVQVSDGSAVEAFMGFGNDMPDPSNLYLVSPDFVVEDLWFGNEGVKSRYWDKGAYDRFLNIHNTIHISYETNPGQVSGLSGDTDQVYMFRLWHGTFWEAVGLGLKWMGNDTFVFYGHNGEAFTSAPVTPRFGTDYMLRLTYKTSDLSIKVYLNGEEIISDNLVAPLDIREFSIGTNSHPLAQHFRFYGLKRGEFTDAELATLENNSNRLWPRGQKPSFPYIDGVGSGVYTDFDRETNAWTLPAGERINFVGGSGEPGAHLYQWYYWNPDLDADGGSGPLDRHFPFVGATTVTLDRDDYKAAGEPFHGHEGDGFNRVFCVITPVDSQGVQGVALRSTIWYDNIQ